MPKRGMVEGKEADKGAHYEGSCHLSCGVWTVCQGPKSRFEIRFVSGSLLTASGIEQKRANLQVARSIEDQGDDVAVMGRSREI